MLNRTRMTDYDSFILFTGIIEELGKSAALKNAVKRRLVIEARTVTQETNEGDSISVMEFADAIDVRPDSFAADGSVKHYSARLGSVEDDLS